MEKRHKELIEAAIAARENSFSPYSNFKVGAAVLGTEGMIFTGCNIESASYGLTICAERVAIFKAISDGYREFLAIAIATDTESPAPPCGACRQLIWEFGGGVQVILANLGNDVRVLESEILLPSPFDSEFLDS